MANLEFGSKRTKIPSRSRVVTSSENSVMKLAGHFYLREMEEVKVKVCIRCNREKSLDDYYSYKRKGIWNKDGACKSCKFEASKKYKPFYTKDYSITDLPNEVWKTIPSLFGYYDVSNLGRIKSNEREVERVNGKNYIKPQQLMSPCNNGNGYFTVMLTTGGKSFRKYIHRLVIEAFTGICDCESVDHINGDKDNNTLDNLRCITARENNTAYQERNKNKSCKSVGVSYYKALEKFGTSIKIESNNYSLGTYSSEKEASDVYQEALYNWNTYHLKPRVIKERDERSSSLKGIYTRENGKLGVCKYFNYRQYYLKSFNTVEEATIHRDRLFFITDIDLDDELLKFIIEEYKTKYLND